MRKVTPKQARFVSALVRNGGRMTAAALEAGCKPASAAVTANKWLKLPWVQEARKQAVWEAFESLAPLATATLAEIIEDKDAPAAARVKAIDLALNRGGFPMVNVSRHELVDSRSTEEMRAELLALRDEINSLGGPLIDVTPGSNPVAAVPNRLETQANFDGNGLLDRDAAEESEDK